MFTYSVCQWIWLDSWLQFADGEKFPRSENSDSIQKNELDLHLLLSSAIEAVVMMKIIVMDLGKSLKM